MEDIVDRLEDPRVRLVNRNEHEGKGFAINRAFEASQGRFIAYLDDDDIWYPDHLQSLILPLRTISDMEMSYSDAYDVTLEEDGEGGYREVKRELRYHHQKTIHDLVVANFIQGISVLHSRHLFEKAGGMDEELEVLIDWDLLETSCFSDLSLPCESSDCRALLPKRYRNHGKGADYPPGNHRPLPLCAEQAAHTVQVPALSLGRS